MDSRHAQSTIHSRKITPERPLNVASQNSILRTHYDVNNTTSNSTLLGITVQKSLTKTPSAFVQKTSIYKTNSMI